VELEENSGDNRQEQGNPLRMPRQALFPKTLIKNNISTAKTAFNQGSYGSA